MADAAPVTKKQRVSTKAEAPGGSGGSSGAASSTDPQEPEELAIKDEWIKEEEALEKETQEAEKKKEKADLAKIKNMSKDDKVDRLNSLLQKSVAYSDFLANKIKK